MQITQYSRISICKDVWYVSVQPIPSNKLLIIFFILDISLRMFRNTGQRKTGKASPLLKKVRK